MSADPAAPLLLERVGSVAILTLHRPERLNALTSEMLALLLDHLVDLADDASVRAVVLTGSGRAFCVGADLQGPIDEHLLRNRTNGPIGAWIEPLAAFPKPTIAALNGVAAGGGLALALACDLRYAAASARLATSFVRTARPSMDGVSYFLPRIVGMAEALRLLYSGEVVDAEEALRIGLLHRVVDDTELAATVLEIGRQLADGPPVALELLKQQVTFSLGRSLADQLREEELALDQNQREAGHDVEEGYRAFFDKRRPVYRGRCRT